VCSNLHSRIRIDGQDVISRRTSHLSTQSYKSEARIGSRGRRIPTSYHKSWLRDMTPTKRKGRIRRHHAPRPKNRIHIRRQDRGWKVRRHVWHTKRKRIRGPRHWLSIMIQRTTSKYKRICPHGMRKDHGLGSAN
jgi:hypothetical protein